MRYRKIPVVIDAMEFESWDMWDSIHKFANYLTRSSTGKDAFVFDRLHNTWVAFDIGDFIIKGIEGEFYPCNGTVFRKTYEKVQYTTEITGPDDLGAVPDRVRLA